MLCECACCVNGDFLHLKFPLERIFYEKFFFFYFSVEEFGRWFSGIVASGENSPLREEDALCQIRKYS